MIQVYTVHVKAYAGIAKSFASRSHRPSWHTQPGLHRTYNCALERAVRNLRPIPPNGVNCMAYGWVEVHFSDGRFTIHDLPMCDFAIGADRATVRFDITSLLSKDVKNSHVKP